MKKVLFATMLAVLFGLATPQNLSAQDEWTQGKKGIYSVGIGGTQLLYLTGSNYGYGYARNSNIGLSLNVSGEYKVWNWIGAGFQTGIDFLWYHYAILGHSVSGGSATIAIPIGGKVNAHLMDAFGLDIAKKLDVYAGLNLGFGPAIYTGEVGPGVSRAGAIMHVGPQFGARYWFSDKMGVFGEFGYGATFANAGLTF